jgi:ABC-type Na+ efflux pump permease subunit
VAPPLPYSFEPMLSQEQDQSSLAAVSSSSLSSRESSLSSTSSAEEKEKVAEMSKENAEMAKQIKQYEELSKKKEEEMRALANTVAELQKKVDQSKLSEKATAAVANKTENDLKKQVRDLKKASKVETKRKVSPENDQGTTVKKKGKKTAAAANDGKKSGVSRIPYHHFCFLYLFYVAFCLNYTLSYCSHRKIKVLRRKRMIRTRRRSKRHLIDE